MKQLRLFYEGVSYLGRVETYYFHGVQEGLLGVFPDVVLYNSASVDGSTISDKTIEVSQSIDDKCGGFL